MNMACDRAQKISTIPVTSVIEAGIVFSLQEQDLIKSSEE
jgi:hypothetical protein